MKERVSMKSPEISDPHPFVEHPRKLSDVIATQDFKAGEVLINDMPGSSLNIPLPKVWAEHTPFVDSLPSKSMEEYLTEHGKQVPMPPNTRLVKPILPSDANARKAIPVASGFLDYFPAAIAAVAEVSKKGNDQHNPGEPIHWARGKSMDQDDTIMRHFLERGGFDTDGQRHSAKMAWRALALLQLELEAAGAPMARGAR